jgi:hypothetical protein
MKRTVFNLFLFLLAASLCSFTTTERSLANYSAMPIISFESQVIDYGEIGQKE